MSTFTNVPIPFKGYRVVAMISKFSEKSGKKWKSTKGYRILRYPTVIKVNSNKLPVT